MPKFVLDRRTLLTATAGLLAAPAVMRGARGDTPSRTLKLGYADVASSPFRKALDGFADDVRQRTNGAVVIKVFASGELGSQNNILTGMQTGIVDLAAHTAGYVQTLVPRFTAIELPYIFPDRHVAESVLDGPVGKQLFSDLPEKGIYGLSWIHWGWRPVTAVDRKAPNPTDLQGLKIRVQPGPVYVATYKALGAIPVTIDVSEVYVALSQRAVEAVEYPLMSVIAAKTYEVTHVTNNTNFNYNAGALMMSKRRMDGLEPGHQAAVREAATALSAPWRDLAVRLTAESTEFMKGRGHAFVEVDLPAYKAAVRPVYDQFRGTLPDGFVDSVMKQAASV